MKIKIENPKRLAIECFKRGWAYDIQYIGETERGYFYAIMEVNNLKLKSVELLIHKEIKETYDPYEREFNRMINLTYTSNKGNKGKEVNNSIKIQSLRDMSALLESMWKTMSVYRVFWEP
jgi:hypothetical protein